MSIKMLCEHVKNCVIALDLAKGEEAIAEARLRYQEAAKALYTTLDVEASRDVNGNLDPLDEVYDDLRRF